MFNRSRAIIVKARLRRRRYAPADGLNDHHLRDVRLTQNQLGQLRWPAR